MSNFRCYPRNYLGGLRKTKKNLSQDNRCAGRDSNSAYFEYESRESPLREFGVHIYLKTTRKFYTSETNSLKYQKYGMLGYKTFSREHIFRIEK
jgi:hypothetical protein